MDTSTVPGSGHPGRSFDYDWRHGMFFVHSRLQCGGGNELNTLFSWWDSRDSATNTGWPTFGPWHQQIAQGNSAANPLLDDGWMFYDPLNNVMVETFGLTAATARINSMRVYSYHTNSITCFNDAGTGGCAAYRNASPSARGATAGFFDHYYSDHNAGEARYLFFGGYGSGTTCFNDVNAYYPNGSVSLSYAVNTWHAPSVTGTGPAVNSTPCYGWNSAYDTLRDKIWVYKNSTTMSALDVATMTWTEYSVSDASGVVCPNNNCSMIYDAAADKLILLGRTSGAVDKVATLNLQTVIAKTWTAGAYSTSQTAVLIPRPISYPALNTPYTDPLGATVTRVTDATPGATAPANYPVPLYSQIKPTDSSERLMFNSAGRILDITNNYKDLGINLWAAFRSENAIWMRTEALTLNGLKYNESNKFQKCLVVITGNGESEAGTLSCTQLADMSPSYQGCAGNFNPNLGHGSDMNQVSQQDRDKDDRYVVLTCQKVSSSGIVMVVLNVQTGVTGAEFAIHPPANIGGCSPNFGPNYAWVGYLHEYVLVDWGLPYTGNGRLCGIETYNLANAANPSGSWDFVGQVIPDATHGDLAVVGGREYFVAFAAGSSWGALQGTIARCVVPDGWSQTNHAGCTAMLTLSGGGHISAHAFKAPVPYVLYDDDEDGGTVDSPWYAGHGEVVKLYWDSTPGTPHIERLLHTRSSGNWFVPCNSCQASSYRAQAKVTSNMDGTKAWFASSWGPVDAVNTYLIDGVGPAPPTGTVIGGKVSVGGTIAKK
ncbi:MAG: hypothetical protein NTW28_16580 [Candidatus Solibacter sp.]|nr:hypothetical protein [Candidatus Solibacter sp.]